MAQEDLGYKSCHDLSPPSHYSRGSDEALKGPGASRNKSGGEDCFPDFRGVINYYCREWEIAFKRNLVFQFLEQELTTSPDIRKTSPSLLKRRAISRRPLGVVNHYP